MEDTLLDELLEHLKVRRPRWGIMRAKLRIGKIILLNGSKWTGFSHKELELSIRVLEQTRLAEKFESELIGVNKQHNKLLDENAAMKVEAKKLLSQIAKMVVVELVKKPQAKAKKPVAKKKKATAKA